MIKMRQKIKESGNLKELNAPLDELNTSAGELDYPIQMKKEILILYELGLEEYEINYIIYLKTKEKAKLKWGG